MAQKRKRKTPNALETLNSAAKTALELDVITKFFSQNAITLAAKKQLEQANAIPAQELPNHFALLEAWIEFLEDNTPFSIPELPEKRWFQRNPREKPLKLEELVCIRNLISFWHNIHKNGEVAYLIPLAARLEHDNQATNELFQRLNNSFAPGGWSPELTPKFKKLLKEEERTAQRLEQLMFDKIQQFGDQLTETVIFERNGRRVLAVNKTFKRKIPGILQDYSTSGQTAFIEPDTSTPLQNRLQEIFFEKEEEIFQFRVEITLSIQQHTFLSQDLSGLIQQLDRYQALALTAKQTGCHPICPNSEGHLVLGKARHPFLDVAFSALRETHHGVADQNKMVPFNLILDANRKGILISGANAGGKTVTLKTVGLIAWLANHGFPTPVESDSQIPCYDHIFADIGDHQSLSHNLSTYASHLQNIRFILEQEDAKCLILLDELGSGTDPMEGNALAQALMEECLNRDVHLLVTTHQQVLCSYALNEPRLENASMTFDKNRLVPTYQFVLGVPGRSHALEIAQRIGLPQNLLARAQSLVDDNQMDIQQAIINLQEQSKILEKQRNKLKKEERRAQRRILETKQEKQKIEKLQEELKEKGKVRIQNAVKHVEKEFRTLLKEVESRKSRQKLTQKFATKQRELIEDPVPKSLPQEVQSSGVLPEHWQTGDALFLKSWNKKGYFLARDRKNVRVNVGGMTLTVPLSDLVHIKTSAPPQKVHMYADEVCETTVPYELKLIGKCREDALEELKRTLDAAFVQHSAMLKIVHGHGHGILKSAIREFLKRHPLRNHWEMSVDPDNDGSTDLQFRWI